MEANPTIPSLGTVLGVWAHPDDEAFVSAGLMALARRHGQRVVVVTATDGGAGGSPAVRRAELATSLAAVGVTEHRYLGFEDGACDRVPPALGEAAIRAVIDEVDPDTIVTFGPEGMTGHSDHRAVSAWTTAAAGDRRLWYATLTPAFHQSWGAVSGRLGIWMEGGRPPSTPPERLSMAIDCSGDVLDRKMRSLRAHASQTASLIAEVGEAGFREMFAAECFVPASMERAAA